MSKLRLGRDNHTPFPRKTNADRAASRNIDWCGSVPARTGPAIVILARLPFRRSATGRWPASARIGHGRAAAADPHRTRSADPDIGGCDRPAGSGKKGEAEQQAIHGNQSSVLRFATGHANEL